jgi:hypothetical protein
LNPIPIEKIISDLGQTDRNWRLRVGAWTPLEDHRPVAGLVAGETAVHVRAEGVTAASASRLTGGLEDFAGRPSRASCVVVEKYL